VSEEAFAERLDAARRAGDLLDADSIDADLTTEEAYAVQARLLELRVADGERLVGHKLGFTSVAKQEQMGVFEPITGFLTDAMDVPVGRLDLADLRQPRVEPEIAFRLAADLGGPEVDRDAVLAATTEVLAAVEVLDSRYRDFRFTLPTVVADNTSAARFVLAPSGLAPDALDLVAERVEFSVGGGEPRTATGEDVLGDPATAVAWLARRTPLEAGQVVLSGGMMDATAVVAGDTVRAVYSTLGEIVLECV
jgi:2-oxo-3-hexenedioate decarboxylase